jgi:general secretion pathway protein D
MTKNMMRTSDNILTILLRQAQPWKCGLFVLVLAFCWTPESYSQSDSAEGILQREEIRRQELMLRANMQLEQVMNLVNQDRTEEAAELLENILENVPNVGRGKTIHERAGLVLSEVETRRAQESIKERDWFGARDRARRALELNPQNRAASVIVRKANDQLGADETGETNPAVTPTFIQRYNEVLSLIETGQDYVETGQYKEAEESFKKALAIDPYNSVAIRELKQLNVIMRKSARIAHQSVNSTRATDVVEQWSNEISVTEKVPSLVDTQSVLEASNQSLLGDKLKDIIIPVVDFTDATIEDAANFLTVKTRELDGVENGGGVPFIVKDEAVSQSRAFSLQLKNAPAGEVLRYAANLSGVKFKIAEYAVFIVPLTTVDDETVITREFPVTPSFWDVASAGDDSGSSAVSARFSRRSSTAARNAGGGRGFDAKKVLEQRGVDFTAAGATAVYNDATGIMTVTNTQNQIDLIEELVIGTNLETLLVKVETKFIEIDQTELDSLVPNIRLQGAYSYSGVGTQFAAGSVRAGTNLSDVQNLRNSDGLSGLVGSGLSIPDIIDGAANSTITQNNIGVTGFLDGNSFAALVNALSQAESTELLTAPSIVVNSGEQGSITVAREFFYPTEYDEPQVQVGSGTISVDDDDGFSIFDSIRFTAVPAFPTDFAKRNVGVVMSVNPRVSVDRQRVYLNIDPEVVEFDGFINYGPQIFATNVSGEETAQVLSENTIEQPVFNIRTIENAQVEVQDGFTVVLGGLMREEVNTVEEKVPLLGDIPLLGRAFRSEVEKSSRRNLLIFVSVRILRPDGQPYNLQGTGTALAN